ncbi:hypothetical protein EYF80_008019 [Liparis tanakae]|uniref:Uncharacterized protein n=1 Tax=Liparis tanakae TaxID=230148 RepID=A0A4Z2IVK6_9TELE|nr:hypothetical protein EYF80_008019 [Liparis tanakae]
MRLRASLYCSLDASRPSRLTSYASRTTKRAVELRAQQRAPAEVIKLVVPPHVVDLHATGAELPQHGVQRPVRGAVALVEAVDKVSQLEDELRLHSRLGPPGLGVPQQLQAGAVVAPPRPEYRDVLLLSYLPCLTVFSVLFTAVGEHILPCTAWLQYKNGGGLRSGTAEEHEQLPQRSSEVMSNSVGATEVNPELQ